MTKVYVSATYQDLKPHREAARDAIQRLGFVDVAMESYTAEDRRPLDRCLADARRCDIYLGIFAWRYGFIPDGYEKSITELEYDAAVEAGRPRLIFLLDEDAPWPRRFIDREPDAARIEALRDRLSRERLCHMFTSEEDLAVAVTAALARHMVGPGGTQGVVDAAAREAYLEQLRRQLGNLDLDTLTPPQNDTGTLRIRLSSVFVESSVRADPPPVELPREWNDPVAGSTPPDEVDAETLAMLHDAYRSKPRQAVLDVLTAPGRRLTVLLGDPGAGKSTVAHYVALQLAEDCPDTRLLPLRGYLPVVIELRMYAALRAEEQCSNFREYLRNRHENELFALDPQALWNHLISGEPAVIIFDGLDEIFDGGRRQEIARQIHEFAARFPSARVIVTSRILEYLSRGQGHVRSILTGAGFEHFTLQELDSEQISSFLTNWFVGVLGQSPRDAAQRSAGMVRDILGSRSLRELAGNPMLLTILAIINRHQVLPRDRWRLYHHAAGVLVEHWDVGRSLGPDGGSELADADDKHELLRRVAYGMQTGRTRYTGNYVTRDVLLRVVEDYLVERYELDRDRAHSRATAVIDQLRERNFILSRYDSHMYGFVHRTFLEFFAAEAILDLFRHQRRWSFDRVKTVFSEHWPEASWREVLRLIASQLSEADNSAIVEVLTAANRSWLVADSAPLPWNVTLAVQCLAQVRRLSLVRDAAEHLLRRVMLLLEQCSPVIEAGPDEAGDRFRPAPEVISGATVLIEEEILPAAAVIGAAWPGRDDYQTWYARRGRWIDSAVGGHAARLAAILAKPEDELPTLLDHVLNAERDVRIANAAIQGLTEIADREQSGLAPPDGAALRVLARAAKIDTRAVVRLAAIEALSRFSGDLEVQRVMVHCIRFDPYSYVRLAAVQHFDPELTHDLSPVEVLRGSVEGDSHRQVRQAAVARLVDLPEPDDDVERLLLQRCADDPYAEVVTLAAGPLLARSCYAARLRDILAERAAGAPDDVRRAAVRLLAREADADSRPDLFLDRIDADGSPAVVRAAAEALAGERSAQVRGALLSRLEKEGDEVIRAAIPAILVDVLPPDERPADELIRCAESDPDPSVRAAVLEALAAGGLLRGATGRRAAVLTLAHEAEAPAVRLAAVRALTPASASAAEADALAALAVRDRDTAVRLAAVASPPRWKLSPVSLGLLRVAAQQDGMAQVRAAALRRIAADGPSPDCTALLAERAANDPHEENFGFAAGQLLAAGEESTALDVLTRRVTDYANAEVRRAAIRLLADHVPADPDRVYELLRARLREETDPLVYPVAVDRTVAAFADRRNLRSLLLSRLDDPEVENRCATVRALGRWCDVDRTVRDRVTAMAAADEDADIRRAAVAALGAASQRAEVRDFLLSRLDDPEPSVRIVAIQILGHRLGADPRIKPLLVRHLGRETDPGQCRAIEATLLWTGDVDVDVFPDRGSVSR